MAYRNVGQTDLIRRFLNRQAEWIFNLSEFGKIGEKDSMAKVK